MKTQTIRTIHGTKHEQVTQNMPAVPFVGQRFRPDGTNSIATVTEVYGTKSKPGVNYTFAHDTTNPPVYSRPYAEVVSMSWDVPPVESEAEARLNEYERAVLNTLTPLDKAELNALFAKAVGDA